MRKKFLILLASFGVALVAASINFWGAVSATTTGTNSFLVPSSASSTTAPNNETYLANLSANGKYAIVQTLASNSILGSSGVSYLLNTQNGTSSKYIESTAGTAGSPNQYPSGGATGIYAAKISETGRYVAFISTDTNLIDGTTTSGTNAQLYLRDTTAGTTTLLSKDSSGNLANAPIADVEGVSEDGRFILFATKATNLATNATNGVDNFIMLDRNTSSFTIMNLDTSGNDPTGNSNFREFDASMSCDGSFVTFTYMGSLNGTDGGTFTTYLLDRRNGNKLTTLSSSSGAPTISCNGDYIGLVTQRALDPGFSTDGNNHAFAYDRINGTFRMIDQSTSGAASNGNVAIDMHYSAYDDACNSTEWGLDRGCLHISDNGIATFSSIASNLVSGAPSGINAYIRNINTGETDLISPTADSAFETPAPIGISSDGKVVVYQSTANDLVSGGTDTNGVNDAFLYQTGM